MSSSVIKSSEVVTPEPISDEMLLYTEKRIHHEIPENLRQYVKVTREDLENYIKKVTNPYLKNEIGYLIDLYAIEHINNIKQHLPKESLENNTFSLLDIIEHQQKLNNTLIAMLKEKY